MTIEKIAFALVAALGVSHASAQTGFTGGYALQHWATSGIQGGTTQITPASGHSATAKFSYDVSLGNPGAGVTFRTTTFSNIAPATGTVSFDWEYTGFHAFFSSTLFFEIYADTSAGRQSTVIIPQSTATGGGNFQFTGTNLSIAVEEGMEWGVTIGGSNFDSNSTLRGDLLLSNFTGPKPIVNFNCGYELDSWSATGIAGGSTQITPSSGPAATAAFSYDVFLGNPGFTVSFRTATFSQTAPRSGTVSFNWEYTGFHAFARADLYFEVFAQTSAGRQSSIIIPRSTPTSGGNFLFNGSVKDFVVEEGMEWGLIIGGSNLDSNSTLNGKLVLSDFVAPLPPSSGFSGGYELQNWSTNGITAGTTAINPSSGSSSVGQFSYNVDLGSPGPGVPFRTATFSNTASTTGDVSFCWEYTGFHAFATPNLYFEVYAQTSLGRTSSIIIPQDTPTGTANFHFVGTVTNFKVEQGMEWGLIIGGGNGDSNSRVRGTLRIPHFDAPQPLVCPCACDFDTSTGTGVCDIFDFLAFQNGFVGADPCACEIDTSTGQGICDIFDFLAFQNQFVGGCP